MLFRLVRDPGTPPGPASLRAAKQMQRPTDEAITDREGEAGQAPPQNPRVEIHAQACSPE